MVALSALGVITGTILSFELGLLWPAFAAPLGSVFGVGFAVEGPRVGVWSTGARPTGRTPRPTGVLSHGNGPINAIDDRTRRGPPRLTLTRSGVRLLRRRVPHSCWDDASRRGRRGLSHRGGTKARIATPAVAINMAATTAPTLRVPPDEAVTVRPSRQVTPELHASECEWVHVCRAVPPSPSCPV